MQVLDNKALLFVTKKADQITQLIPKSKVIARNGDKAKILVNWGHEEAKVLRNLRLKDVPHPILGKYDWPGVYTPFEHQRSTAAFLAENKRAYVFNEQGCVDADTEYLSPTGWRRIADYVEGQVAQFIPETGAIEFVTPTEFVKKPCTRMIRFQTKYGIDQLLSPEHRVLAYNNALPDRPPVVLSAQEVLDKHARCYAGVKDPKGRTVGAPTVSFRHLSIKPTFTTAGGAGIPLTDAQLRLQIAVMADGHFPGESSRCVVRLKRPRKITRMQMLLGLADIPYEMRMQDTATAKGYYVFKFDAPMRTKVYGSEFWAATPAQLAVVCDEAPKWDGSYRKGNKGFEFVTTSKPCADFVQYAMAACGFVTTLSNDNRVYKSGGPLYKVYARNKEGTTGLLALHSSSRKDVVREELSTDGFKYCFCVPSTFLLLRRNGRIFATGNTGKTSAAIWAADYLMNHGEVTRALIVCPVSIMDTAWRSDLFKTAMHRRVGIATGSKKRRIDVLNGDYEFVIINFDGVKVIREEIAAAGFDLFIIDEASNIKHATSDRWKALNSVIRKTDRVWAMTGTPASQAPTDAYGLARMVVPESVPQFFGRFRDSVMVKVTQFKWVPRADAKDRVFNLLQPAIRFTKEECLDLPEMLYTTREIPLTKQQTHYYEMVRKQMVAIAAGEEITAVNAAGLLNRLLQISAGASYTTDGGVVDFDITNRLNELLDVIANTDQKVLVFVPFRHVLDRLESEMAKAGITSRSIHGGVSAGERAEAIKAFQSEDNPRVMLAQPAATAHGITLTRADTVVWWGPVASAELYLQGNARAHRAGQTNKVTVVRLQGSPVERRIYNLLDSKVDLHNALVDLYKEETLDAKP